MKCKRGLAVEVLESGAGFYLGTKMELEGGLIEPNCRISSYWKYKTEAQEYLKQFENKKVFTDRNCIENNFCNGGTGCFIL